MTLLLGFIVLFVGWLAPGHFLPWINFQNEVAAATGGLLLGVSACVAVKRDQGISWPAPAAVAIVDVPANDVAEQPTKRKPKRHLPEAAE